MAFRVSDGSAADRSLRSRSSRRPSPAALDRVSAAKDLSPQSSRGRDNLSRGRDNLSRAVQECTEVVYLYAPPSSSALSAFGGRPAKLGRKISERYDIVEMESGGHSSEHESRLNGEGPRRIAPQFEIRALQRRVLESKWQDRE